MIYDTNAIEKGTLIKRASSPKEQDIFDLNETGFSKVMIPPSTPTTEKIYYGAHIPTLCEKLERGDFEHSNQTED